MDLDRRLLSGTGDLTRCLTDDEDEAPEALVSFFLSVLRCNRCDPSTLPDVLLGLPMPPTVLAFKLLFARFMDPVVSAVLDREEDALLPLPILLPLRRRGLRVLVAIDSSS